MTFPQGYGGMWPVGGCTAFVVGALIVSRRPRFSHGRWSAMWLDPFSRILLESLPGPDGALAWKAGLLWGIVSLFTNLVVPLAGFGPSFLKVPYEALQALNYTVAVPILFGAYIQCVVCLHEFMAPSKLDALGIRRQPTWFTTRGAAVLSSWILVLAAILIDLAISLHVARKVSGYEVWVTPGGHGDFTLAGVIYYTMRGTNAMLALGLLGAVVMACLVLCRELRFGPEPGPGAPRLAVVDRSMRVDRTIMKLGSCVMMTFCAASVVIALEVTTEVAFAGAHLPAGNQPVGLFSEYLRSVGTELSRLIFFWVATYAASFLFVGLVLNRLRILVDANLEQVRAEAMKRFEGRSAGELAAMPEYWQTVSDLRENVNTVQVWPVPRYFATFVGGNLAALLAGPLASAYLSYLGVT